MQDVEHGPIEEYTMIKWILLLAVCFVAGCQTTETRLTFDEALARAKAQPADVRYPYEEEWAAFNNSNHIDQKSGCYRKSSGPIQQILVINKSGVVTDVITDVDNEKSRCFRDSFLDVKFPAPPVAPFYVYLRMR